MVLGMYTLAVVLARAGSKGLPDKCVRAVAGRPMVAHAIDHALRSGRLNAVVLTTDSPQAARVARDMGVQVIDRPAELATDHARVDAAVRHAVWSFEAAADNARGRDDGGTLFEDRVNLLMDEATGNTQEQQQVASVLETTRPEGACPWANRQVDAVVILYGNIPVRASGIIDRCIEHLERTGCDSVRTLAPVSKQHPDWLHRLHGDRMEQYRPNSIHRRQELEPLYYHDGAVVAVTRAALFAAENSDDPHAFFGRDRRAVVQAEEDTVDVDSLTDLYRAEAVLRSRQEAPSGVAGP